LPLGPRPPPAVAVAAAAVGAPASGWLLPPAFFFLFLLLLLPPWASGLLSFPTPKAGEECLARPSAALAYFCQAEELGDNLNVVRGELFQHFPIPYTLAKCNHNRSIGDTRDGVVNLRELLDEGTQSLARVLLYGMEVGLIVRLRVSTLKVGRELVAQLSLGGERPL
jgi:hypothetical protein